jgi:hypothetical protein
MSEAVKVAAIMAKKEEQGTNEDYEFLSTSSLANVTDEALNRLRQQTADEWAEAGTNLLKASEMLIAKDDAELQKLGATMASMILAVSPNTKDDVFYVPITDKGVNPVVSYRRVHISAENHSVPNAAYYLTPDKGRRVYLEKAKSNRASYSACKWYEQEVINRNLAKSAFADSKPAASADSKPEASADSKPAASADTKPAGDV